MLSFRALSFAFFFFSIPFYLSFSFVLYREFSFIAFFTPSIFPVYLSSHFSFFLSFFLTPTMFLAHSRNHSPKPFLGESLFQSHPFSAPSFFASPFLVNTHTNTNTIRLRLFSPAGLSTPRAERKGRP